MQNQLGLLVKVLLLSVGLSILIKYACPFLPIPGTATNALIMVLSPTVVLGTVLLWRMQGQQNIN
ncbi:MAG: hypothetical protein QNJ47_15430 [Nostocaceae cyanobacterium]|nr:hypothetical protein [Nostocaceae cyanobacterium]